MQHEIINLDGSGLTATDYSQNQISAVQAPIVKLKWAEPDLNRRPLARKANVLTRLDDRPTVLNIEIADG